VNSPLVELLSSVDRQPTVAQYGAASRALDALRSDLRPVRVALLATHTVDPLVPFLTIEAARRGFDAAVYVAPFDSVSQELLDPESGLERHEAQIVFILMQLEDVCRPLAEDFLGLDSGTVDCYIDEIVSTQAHAWRQFRNRSAATIVVGNCVGDRSPLLGIYEPMAAASRSSAVRRLNDRLVNAARAIPGVYVQDVDQLAASTGYEQWRDERMWKLARSPLSAIALRRLASSCATFVHAAFGSPKKCVVLDLDNTLWGGVVGEVGLGGITLGPTYPGSAFCDFQRLLLSLHRRGVVLAINSKNNESEIHDVFQSHPDMVLKAEHFSATRINWRDKVENMLDLSGELGLGLDSFVFFDDSAAECERMKEALPEVLTIQAPSDVLSFGSALMKNAPFDRLSWTDEDRRRTDMYREQTARRDLAEAVGGVEAFLERLEMSAEVKPVDALTLSRAAELTQKTNQFNVATGRYTTADMAASAASADRAVLSMRLLDRFGDNGVIGLGIARAEHGTAVIEEFLLSCRVIGRHAETALLSSLVAWAKARGLREMRGTFIPTAKNAPAADFFQKHGFSRTGELARGSIWTLDIVNDGVPWPTHIRPLSPLPGK
jgi:FkbH-like protein